VNPFDIPVIAAVLAAAADALLALGALVTPAGAIVLVTLAVRALLLDAPTNHYGPNGHVYQRPDLPAYLPANGGLLAAVGMMAAGWEGEPAPRRPAPGFPNDGRWSVRHEKIRPWL